MPPPATMYSTARRCLRSVKPNAHLNGRGFRSSSAIRNSEATLHRSYELGAVEETQNIATMDKLLRTFRKFHAFDIALDIYLHNIGDRSDPAHQS